MAEPLRDALLMQVLLVPAADIGRQKNADPKWLLPLICRRGHVTKNEIGAIKIQERESRFEIAAEAAERFEEALRRTDDEEIRIERAEAPGGGDGGPKGSHKPAHKGGTYKGAPRKGDRSKPGGAAPRGKSRYDKPKPGAGRARDSES